VYYILYVYFFMLLTLSTKVTGDPKNLLGMVIGFCHIGLLMFTVKDPGSLETTCVFNAFLKDRFSYFSSQRCKAIRYILAVQGVPCSKLLGSLGKEWTAGKTAVPYGAIGSKEASRCIAIAELSTEKKKRPSNLHPLQNDDWCNWLLRYKQWTGNMIPSGKLT